jgi:hypothetical protein
MDINNHPLTDFFKEVAKEYERGMAKYGRWSDIPEEKQIDAVEGEFNEWFEAYLKQDATGPHGELAELPQLANVAGRRWRIMRKRTQQPVEEETSASKAINKAFKSGIWVGLAGSFVGWVMAQIAVPIIQDLIAR